MADRDPENPVSDEKNEDINKDLELLTGISHRRSIIIVMILVYINLINYMDRYTIAVFIFSYMVFAPVFGYLGDRYNRKYIMGGGIAFWSLITLSSSFITKEYFWLLLITRGLVGVGEASYSTIAPTLIADLFLHDERSRMLSFFYLATPVGCGLGYIAGSKVSSVAGGDWHWALRVTPGLGLVAVLLLLFMVQEPPRGAAEGKIRTKPLTNSSWMSDIKSLLKNPSFVLSTFGSTAVAFIAGALSLWAPTLLMRARTVLYKDNPCQLPICSTDDSLIFGVITCVTGIVGVIAGVEISKRCRKKNPRSDALVCGFSLLCAQPFLYVSLVIAQKSLISTYIYYCPSYWKRGAVCVCVHKSQYVVIPTRRGTAGALQIVVSHILGDAGSPYAIGVIMISDLIRKGKPDSDLLRFNSLGSALIICAFVGVIGGGFFLATSFYIEKDRKKAEKHAHSLIFGVITCVTGIVGVIAGVEISKHCRKKKKNMYGRFGLCLWPPVHTALPLRLLSGSTISDLIRKGKPDSDLLRFNSLGSALIICAFVGVIGGGFFLATSFYIEKDRKKAESYSQDEDGEISDLIRKGKPDSDLLRFNSLGSALIICAFVGVIGGGFFLATSFYIEKDRKKAESYSQDEDGEV
ncbi:spinster homolog 1 [Pelobates cultripes]|uniref:Protein spinster homolog 1 n=1 Tax=Pelobates cultripes TaxID=61616 RepID=A0AAD1WPH6_PELCU|nr:spinster homolog 1 [Pelobates cultripes]